MASPQDQEPLPPEAIFATSSYTLPKDEPLLPQDQQQQDQIQLSQPQSQSQSQTSSSPTPSPSNDRLSTPFPIRLPLTTTLAFTTGFFLGAAHGGQISALRFRAENAHRLPTSQVGWYLYHKSKNYHAMLGGIKEGLRMGARIGVWTGVFFAVEEAVDRTRGAFIKRVYGFRERRKEEKRMRGRLVGAWGEEDEVAEEDRVMGLERIGGGDVGPVVWVQRDFLSTVVAALGTAGAFSAWNRFPVETAARTALMGLKGGLAFGVAQDALALVRGRRLGYVEFVKRHLFGKGEREGRRLSVAG